MVSDPKKESSHDEAARFDEIRRAETIDFYHPLTVLIRIGASGPGGPG